MGQKGGKLAKGGKNLVKFKSDRVSGTTAKDLGMLEKLKAVPLLVSYTDEELTALGEALVAKKFAAGANLVNEGDPGEGFFIIESGSCTVTKKQGDGSAVEIGKLKDGDYFGELALLNNKPRGATVTAVSAISTFYLSRADFQKLFNSDGLTKVKFAKRAAVSDGLQDKSRQSTHTGCTDKDKATTKLILKAVSGNVLFSGQTEATRKKLVAQMFKEEVKGGSVLIKKGEKGDLFYVVQKGTFDIDVDGTVVASRGEGTCFGELALMYNAPRAATVTAKTDASVWVIDRYVYRSVVKETSAALLSEFSDFLKVVPLLAPLTSFEREGLAETMDLMKFKGGDTVFDQGTQGNHMYIVRSGECVVEKDGKEVTRCKKGDYFGERALVKNETRAATVKTAENTEVQLLTITREAFHTLLGPLEEILNQQAHSYEAKKARSSQIAPQEKTIKFEDLVVLGTLGKGSFGHVQLVQDKTTKQTYALKGVSKAMIVETGQQGHIMSEKNVMAQLKHPFLITLHQTFKDQDRLYFLLEPVLGGELFTILRSQTLFDENTARFYAACVTSAFEYMQESDIIYRDLKPENLLVDSEGFIKITDFGFAKKITTGRTWTLCGTPDYLAPEIVAGKGHGKGVDWWTLGILIYEMLASYPPFYDEDPMRTYAKIMAGDVTYPSHFSKPAVSLIKKLLNAKSTKRLGVVKGGAKLIKKHPWFEPLDFEKLNERALKAPMIPNIKNAMDLSNFDADPDEEEEPFVPYTDDGSNWDADF